MKKGFTLIELLAVIVILAIIALIATPIVLNIIEETKESATLRSAEYYLTAVEHSIMKKNMIVGGSFSPNTCEIQGDGNLLCDGKDTLEVEVNGATPTGGTITFDKGKITNVELTLGNKNVVKNEKGELVLGEPYAKVLLTDYLTNLYSETTTTTVNEIEYSLDETHLLMNDRLGSSDTAKLDGNIRYYGANPNNYIDIGDRDSEGNIIFWRIIGLFKDIEVTDESGTVTKTEDLVKIVRADKLTSGDVDKFSMDYDFTYSNESWATSTLATLLNDEVNGYYGSGSTTYYYVETDGSTLSSPISLNFASTGLSSDVHSKVERVKYGLLEIDDVTAYSNEIYTLERSGALWSGKIALMHMSDYGYSTGLKLCNSATLLQTGIGEWCIGANNWLNKSQNGMWFIAKRPSDSPFYLAVSSSSIYSNFFGATQDVYPVLYLKSNTNVVDEKETSEGLKYLVIE